MTCNRLLRSLAILAPRDNPWHFGTSKNVAAILLRKPIDDGTCGANQMRRTSPSAGSDPAAYFPATILMLFATEVTPLTACAIETALSAASCVLTLPLSV